MVLTEDKNFFRELFRLAPPIALSSLAAMLLPLFVNAAVSALGDGAVAGVYLSNQIVMVLQTLTVGIEGAVVAAGSQLHGGRNVEGARRFAALGLWLAFLLGLALTLPCLIAPRAVLSLFTGDSTALDFGADYLGTLAFSFLPFTVSQSLAAAARSSELPKAPLAASLAALAVGAFLCDSLVFGKRGFAELGAQGAAIAVACARLCEFALLFAVSFFLDKKLGLRLRDLFRVGKNTLALFFKCGAPIVAAQAVWCVNTLFASALMGRQSGEGVLSAVGIATGLYNLSYVVSAGLAGAVGILTGKYVGAGEGERIIKLRPKIEILFLALGVLTAILMQAAKAPFLSLYSVTDAARAEAVRLINVLSVLSVGTCYQSACLFGLIKNGGRPTLVLITDAAFVFVVIIPLSLLADALGALPWVVFALLKSDQLLKCPVAAVLLRRCDWTRRIEIN